MKVLIEVTMSNLFGIPSPDDYRNLISNFARQLEKDRDRFDCFYGKTWDSGIAIATVDSMEEAWELIMRNPMYPYWKVEITALTDPMRINRAYADSVAIRFA
jgi:hypothetical protein